MKKIKNEKRPDIDYLIHVNLNDIIVIARKKEGIERVNKLKMKFRIIDEYETEEINGKLFETKTIVVNDEKYICYTPKDFTVENMLEIVNNELNIGLSFEEIIKDKLLDVKTVEFVDDIDERIKNKNNEIIDMKV